MVFLLFGDTYYSCQTYVCCLLIKVTLYIALLSIKLECRMLLQKTTENWMLDQLSVVFGSSFWPALELIAEVSWHCQVSPLQRKAKLRDLVIFLTSAAAMSTSFSQPHVSNKKKGQAAAMKTYVNVLFLIQRFDFIIQSFVWNNIDFTTFWFHNRTFWRKKIETKKKS